LDETLGSTKAGPEHRVDAPARPPAEASPRAARRAVLSTLGLALLVLWGYWWATSIDRNKLVKSRNLWFASGAVLKMPLALDLVVPGMREAKAWWSGGDPYAIGGVYPPHLYRLLGWTTLVSPRTAAAAWVVALGAMALAGGWAAWRTRRGLGLGEVSLPFVMLGVVVSTPVVFAMERGNCDLAILLTVVVSVALLRSRSLAVEVVVGLLMANAMWMKYYPGLLMLGMVALRRWRVLPSFVLGGVAIGLIDHRGILACIESVKRWAPLIASTKGYFQPDTHSLSNTWAVFWEQTPLPLLARLPGSVGAIGLMMPLAGWISSKVYRCPHRALLAFPYLIWLLALATFIPTIAVDYNLLYLPVAVLAVWDRRDPVVVHMMIGLLMLWWQPLALPIDGRVMLVVKVLGLVAVALSLAARTREPPGAVAAEAEEVAATTGRRRPRSKVEGLARPVG